MGENGLDWERLETYGVTFGIVVGLCRDHRIVLKIYILAGDFTEQLQTIQNDQYIYIILDRILLMARRNKILEDLDWRSLIDCQYIPSERPTKLLLSCN